MNLLLELESTITIHQIKKEENKMETKEKFDIILSKNRLAREVKNLYKKLKQKVPEFVIFDFSEIEKSTGEMNQPTAKDILTTNMDI